MGKDIARYYFHPDLCAKREVCLFSLTVLVVAVAAEPIHSQHQQQQTQEHLYPTTNIFFYPITLFRQSTATTPLSLCASYR
jgi:hypothetical protein